MAKSTKKVRKLTKDPELADFGGDPVKMALQRAVDTGRPQTRVDFTLEGEAEVGWRNRQFGDLGPKAIAINLAKLHEAGEIRGSQRKDGTVAITVSDVAVMERLAEMVREFNESRPVSRDDAMNYLREGKSRIDHLKQRNSGLDFGLALELMDGAQTTFNAHALNDDGDRLNYKPVADTVRSAVRSAEDIVANSIAAGIRRMGAPDAEGRLTKALAVEDLQGRRNALLELRALLVGMGYSDPEFVSKRQETTQRAPQRRREGPTPKRHEQRRVRF